LEFNVERLRRLRSSAKIRGLVRENKITKDDLIQPLFVCHGNGVKNEVKSMPGVFQMSVDNIVKECKEIESLGLPAVILFGIPEKKDPTGSSSLTPDAIVAQAIRAIKEEVKDLLVIADVCLCEYTSHGHCGVVENGKVLNDETVTLLVKQSINFADAGVDVVAPSDMMDGRVAAIRDNLDDQGYIDVPIISYSAKYSSAFYAPFRDAAESAPEFGDRKTYQMDPANSDEALREVEADLDEGADIVMVKPGMPYLDIVRRIKEEFNVPVAVYNVSGEYSMVKAAALNGWIDEDKVVMEMLLSMKRAGADLIFTYFAKQVAKKL
jgi:porphobilinogen synthase